MSERIIKKNNFFIPLFSGLIALILIVSGTFYLFSRLGVFKKSEVPTIRAPETPVKVKPEISGGKNMMKWSEKNSLMNRNINLEDVGKSGLYLLSDMSSGVTGEVHYVDCVYNKVGVPKEI